MKIAFLFVISCTLLMHATGAVAASEQEPSEHLPNPTPAHTRKAGQALSSRRNVRHITGAHSSGEGHVVFPNRELPSERAAATATNGVMNKGFTGRTSAASALPTRPSTAVSPTAPSLGNLRHRDPNPPVIGGPASASRSRAGEINGTTVRREH